LGFVFHASLGAIAAARQPEQKHPGASWWRRNAGHAASSALLLSLSRAWLSASIQAIV